MNILVATYWSFNDPLVQTYTLPYIEIMQKYLPAGSHIYLQTLEQKNYAIPKEKFRKIKDEYAARNIHIIDFSYARFGLKAIFNAFIFIPRLAILIFSKNINTIHAWCTPGGAIGYVLSKLTGRPLILDSFEPHAEVMLETKVWTRKSLAFRILFWLEKKQVQRAKAVIGLTRGMVNYSAEKFGVRPGKYFIKPSLVDFSIFNPFVPLDTRLQEELGLKDKIVCVYAGKIGGIYLTKEIFDLFKVASEYWGDKFKVLFLTRQEEAEVLGYAKRASLDPKVVVTRFVPHTDIAKWMRMATFAINPVKPVPSRKHCTSIKDGEYWGMGLPIVITPDISDDSSIIEQNQIGAILRGFTKDDYLNTVKEMDRVLHTASRDELAGKIFAIGQKYRSFAIAEAIYKELYGKQEA